MNKNILNTSIIITGILFAGMMAGSVLAQTDTSVISEISYPIAELGNCADKATCKTYCDVSENLDACLSFAEKKNMMSKDQIDAAKNFKKAGMIGPGGCKGKTECDNYCGDKVHLDECISFAEKNNLMPAEQLKEAKQVQAAIVKGIKLPACSDKKACDVYCSSAEHMEECITFATEAGIMDSQKQESSKKVLTAIKQGVKPPACNGKEECDKYCSEPTHMQECLTFGIAAGTISSQDQEKARKTLDAIKQGINPPNCKGEQECKTYCGQESNLEECLNFAQATGKVTSEQAIAIRKTGGKSSGVGPDQGQGGPGEGEGPGEGAGQGRGGPGEGDGPGNGAGQGGGDPNQGLGQGGQNKLNPTKCINDCELAGRNCISALSVKTEICRSNGQYCREVTCETKDAEGNRDTAEVMHACNDLNCTPAETICNNAVTVESSACTTQKDVCVMDCQKASKPTKPNQPLQPIKPGEPTQPTKPTQPGQQPAQPAKPEKPADAVNPTKCINDCELAGRNCISALRVDTEICRSNGQYCREVTCETKDAEGNRDTAEVMHACNDLNCTPAETICNNAVTVKNSACTTKKDVCVMDCQKASKPTKPSQPTQPSQSGQPGQQPTKPTQPLQPGQSGQNQPMLSGTGPGGCKTVEECTTYCQSHPEAQLACQQFKQSQKQEQSGQNQLTPPSQPTPPQQPMPPQQPTQPPQSSNFMQKLLGNVADVFKK